MSQMIVFMFWILMLGAGCTEASNDNVPGVPSLEISGELILESEDGRLKVYQHDDGNLEGAYTTLQDRRVTFETLRGEQVLADVDPNISSTLYEVDVRFKDQDGTVFLIGIGGHGVMDPEWDIRTYDPESAEASSRPGFDFNHRIGDFLAAREAAGTLATIGLDTDLASEYEAIIGSGGAVIENDLYMDGDDQLDDWSSEDEQIGLRSGTYTHDIGIYYGDAFDTSLGHHSAVIARGYSLYGSLVTTIVTSNHGRYATDPSLWFSCSRWFGGRTSSWPPVPAEGCHSSWGPTPFLHLCNDDTRVQYLNTKYNTYSTWGTCSDWSVRWWAPTCD